MYNLFLISNYYEINIVISNIKIRLKIKKAEAANSEDVKM